MAIQFLQTSPSQRKNVVQEALDAFGQVRSLQAQLALGQQQGQLVQAQTQLTQGKVAAEASQLEWELQQRPELARRAEEQFEIDKGLTQAQTFVAKQRGNLFEQQASEAVVNAEQQVRTLENQREQQQLQTRHNAFKASIAMEGLNAQVRTLKGALSEGRRSQDLRELFTDTQLKFIDRHLKAKTPEDRTVVAKAAANAGLGSFLLDRDPNVPSSREELDTALLAQLIEDPEAAASLAALTAARGAGAIDKGADPLKQALAFAIGGKEAAEAVGDEGKGFGRKILEGFKESFQRNLPGAAQREDDTGFELAIVGLTEKQQIFAKDARTIISAMTDEEYLAWLKENDAMIKSLPDEVQVAFSVFNANKKGK